MSPTTLLQCRHCGARVAPLDAVYDDGPRSPAHPSCAERWHLALLELVRTTRQEKGTAS